MGQTDAIVNRTRRAVDGEKMPAHGDRSFRRVSTRTVRAAVQVPEAPSRRFREARALPPESCARQDINCPGTGATIFTSRTDRPFPTEEESQSDALRTD